MARTGSINNNKTKNTKIQSKAKSKAKNKKITIKDKKKFGAAFVIIVIIALAVILLFVNNSNDLSKVDDYSKLNFKKYANELLEIYNNEESKDKFLEDYDYIQSAVAMYIMNNSTNLENSFTTLIENLKEELSKENYSELECDRPIFWNGEYSIDDSGIVKFKFSDKKIEPSWINDEELNEKVILN